jgi:hypothetical protein
MASVTGLLARDLQEKWKGAIVPIYKEKQKKTKENDRIVGLWEAVCIWDHDSDVRVYLLMCNFTYSAAHCLYENNEHISI